MPLTPGVNTLAATARDNADNTATAIVNVTYTPPDTTAPLLHISAPAHNATTSTASLTANGTVSDNEAFASGLFSVKVNGTPATVNYAAGTWSLANIALALGSNTLTVQAVDNAGNVATQSLAVTREPVNQAPSVNAGPDQTITLPSLANLTGAANDDGRPAGSSLALSWSQVSGPGMASFADAASLATQVSFAVAGSYVLQLTASDGVLTVSDTLAVIVQSTPAAQETCVRDHEGHDFWVAVPDEALNAPHDFSLLITSRQAANGWVSAPGIGARVAFSVPAGGSTQVALPSAMWLTTLTTASRERVEAKGLHITADQEVAVAVVSYITFATASYLARPTETLGTAFITVGMTGSSPRLYVIAPYNNTIVTLTPGTTLSTGSATHPAGVPYTVTLRAGEVYALEPLQADITGVSIAANRPVNVLSGSGCTTLNGGTCNPLLQALPPVTDWSNEYLVVPFRGRNGDLARFVANTDNTHLYLNATLAATLNRGQFYQSAVTAVTRATADQPFMVAQFANSQSFDGQAGDPVMLLVTPPSQYGFDYLTASRASNFSANYYTLLTPLADIASVLLDGAPLAANSFSPVAGTPFASARVAVTPGVHRVASASATGLFAYGWADFDAYAYAGGFCQAKLVTNLRLTLTPGLAESAPGQNACLAATLSDLNGQPVNGASVSFQSIGVNPVSGMATTNAAGTASFCYTGQAAGSDFVTAQSYGLLATAARQWGPFNFTPGVNAGPDQSVTVLSGAAFPQAVSLHGTASDDSNPPGSSLSYQWSCVNAPGLVSFTAPNAADTTANIAQPGDYTLRLTVSDGQLAVTDDLRVAVRQNQAPTINFFGEPIALLPTPLALSCNVADDGLPPGSVPTVHWSQISGPGSVTFTPANQAATQATFSQTGQYVVRLTASDGDLSGARDVTVVALRPADYSVVATPAYLRPGETITIHWSAPAYKGTFDLLRLRRSGTDIPYSEDYFTNNGFSGTITLTAPSALGQYEMAYFVTQHY